MQTEHDRRERWFQDLVATVGGDLLRFLRSRLRHGDVAQDLAQEVYLRLLRMDDVGLIRNPRSFVIHLAAHAAHEWRMLARNRLQHSEEALEQLVAEAADPAEALEEDDRLHELRQVLATLSPKCQAVLLMHRRDGMTYQEIADHMQLSVAMVKKYMAKGLAACQKRKAEQ
ncbi:sigma-70 family RNA polymerase sigma factor [Steroidobacter sp. S1-65]|uniref:Sigma-70 family RNA polymerase sigma factor n=1 Tax=Steroidobacter gossypii TaxID=2805490 RepID=A0ABS1WZH6_9GAMM|nr:sigma-70 family RNA polymerase sigma factor [Steroidobacter gossypii]MBM0106385.1 sigma-70 family RNA polymerase sigma factor [Steroidobacter gossypii]